ncbi:MAG: hypothetical protein WC523_04785 [Patescibacteria group bacterium]
MNDIFTKIYIDFLRDKSKLIYINGQRMRAERGGWLNRVDFSYTMHPYIGYYNLIRKYGIFE